MCDCMNEDHEYCASSKQPAVYCGGCDVTCLKIDVWTTETHTSSPFNILFLWDA